jgi:hypothetical protein
MQPELAYGYLTKSVYVVTRWARPGVAQTKYDITDQFHTMARRLGYVRMMAVAHAAWCDAPADWGGADACPCGAKPDVPARLDGDHSAICNSVAGSKWQPCNCRA